MSDVDKKDIVNRKTINPFIFLNTPGGLRSAIIGSVVSLMVYAFEMMRTSRHRRSVCMGFFAFCPANLVALYNYRKSTLRKRIEMENDKKNFKKSLEKAHEALKTNFD